MAEWKMLFQSCSYKPSLQVLGEEYNFFAPENWAPHERNPLNAYRVLDNECQ